MREGPRQSGTAPGDFAARRIEGLDALRVWAMLLGVVFHAALCLWPALPLHDWPVRDPQGSAAFGIVAVTLHASRMPIFFFVSGLLTALACRRRGLSAVARSRLSRIGWPLLIGLALLVPFAPLADDFAGRMIDHVRPGTPGVRSLRRHFETHSPLEWVDPSHLWFLQFLLIYIGFAVVASRAIIGRRVCAAVARAWSAIGRRLGGWGLVLVLAAFGAPFAWHSGSTFVETPRLLLPPWHVLAYYGIFYGAGWAASTDLERLNQLFRFPRALSAAAVLGAGALAWWGLNADPPARWVCMAALPVVVSVAVLALVQACVRLQRPAGRVTRLLTDASYWTYLWHLPIITLLHPYLVHLGVPLEARFPLVVALAAGVPLFTFQLFVRRTRLGALLGARAKPGGPQPNPASA